MGDGLWDSRSRSPSTTLNSCQRSRTRSGPGRPRSNGTPTALPRAGWLSVEGPRPLPGEGGRYRVRLVVALPEDEFTITREAGEGSGAADLAAAVQDAFRTANRLLRDDANFRCDTGVLTAPLPRGRVRLVMRDEDWGVLEATDGREVYFRKDSLVNASLDSLATGTEVVLSRGHARGAPEQPRSVSSAGMPRVDPPARCGPSGPSAVSPPA